MLAINRLFMLLLLLAAFPLPMYFARGLTFFPTPTYTFVCLFRAPSVLDRNANLLR